MKALVIIDIQNGLTKRALFHASSFFTTVAGAINEFRKSNSIIVFVQHNNLQLKNGTLDWEFDPRLEMGKSDIVIQKKHGNAFQETELESLLNHHGIDTVTICGLVSHGCVKATCIGSLEAGFKTGLLKNGHTNWNKDAEWKIAMTEAELIQKGVVMEEVALY